MEAISLTEALKLCNEAASEGYDYALKNLCEVKSVINKSEYQIEESIKVLKDFNIKDDCILQSLNNQLNDIKKDLINIKFKADIELQERKNELNEFTITLFGRTMAGKSTLMEIFTNGDGSSIGKGAQRTTRDVRTYKWNDLKIVDVPGIAAFEGQEDEECAFEAARKSDLILFLITDDAPQDEEAKCLAKIISLGKPVIGLCNIKRGGGNLNDPIALKYFLKDNICKKDENRIKEIYTQFDALLQRYNANKIKFISAQLLARYLANQSQYVDYREKLIEISNFKKIENDIKERIIKDGVLLRKKNFIESISTPLISLYDGFLFKAQENSSNGRILISKLNSLKKWKTNFTSEICGNCNTINFKRHFVGTNISIRNKIFARDIEKIYSSLKNDNCKVNIFINDICHKLYNDLDDFIEDNYENSNAGKAWDTIVENYHINKMVNDFCNTILEECNTKIQSLVREIQDEVELKAKYSAKANLLVETIFDSKKYYRWIYNGIIALTNLACLIFGIPVPSFTLQSIAYGILGWFEDLFDSRDEKERKQKKRLKENIVQYIEDLRLQLKVELTNWYYSEIYTKRIKTLEYELSSSIDIIFKVGDAQKDLANNLNSQNKRIIKDSLIQAIEQLQINDLKEHIYTVARVPGHRTLIVLDKDYQISPKKFNHIILNLSKRLQETIVYCFYTDNIKWLISRILGKEIYFRIEDDIKVLHVPSLRSLNQDQRIRSKLAQQVTDLLVME